MRRMRDLTWGYYLLAIPAVGGALGIQYMVRKWFPEPSAPELATALKPSYFKPDSSSGNPVRKPAGKSDSSRDHGPSSHLRPDKDAAGDSVAEAENSHEESAEQLVAGSGADSGDSTFEPAMMKFNSHSEDDNSRGPAAALVSEGAESLAPAKGNQCSSVEYRGDGPEGTKVTKEEWAKVNARFVDAKDDLIHWLEKHRREFPDKTASIMELQVRNLKIQQPPSKDEPDLAWRGIAIWTRDASGAPAIRVGSGFVKLVLKEPARGRFEMTRLVAQAWAPCELQRVDAGAPWENLLKCIGINEAKACGPGSYSEGGWAVSSTIANLVAPPGCNLPALAKPEIAGCLTKPPLPLTASAEPAAKAVTRTVAQAAAQNTGWKD